MASGKNLVEVILRLVDQFTGPWRKSTQEAKKGTQELTEATKQAATATKQSGEAASQAAPKRRRMTDEERAATAAAREAEKAVKQQAQEEAKARREQKQSHDELRQGYQQLAIAATAFLVAMSVAVNKGIEANNKQVAAFTGLRSVVVGTGKDYDQASGFVKKFTEDGLISQANAAEALKNLLSRGFNLDQAIDMLNRLKDSASFGRQAHLSLGEAVKSATEGIKNENSILVDNAGVTKNVSQMWKEYASSIGKGVQSLTVAEKRQAEYNGIMKETRHQVGDAAKLTETFAGQQAKSAKATEEASAALGRAWASALEKVLPLWTGFMNGLKAAMDRFPGLTVALMAVAGGFAALVAAAGIWVTVTTPAVTAAMAAIATKAGIMWAAITGPVGLAIAALGALAAAFYYVATAESRAAKVALDAARQREEAAREAVTTARNRAREIMRQEEDLQANITSLEQQASEKRADITRREMERRREAANRFGELILSALKQKHQQEQDAEEQALNERIDQLKDFHRDQLDQVKQATADQLDALREQLDREKDAIKAAADERKELLRRQHDEELEAIDARREALQDQQQDELDRSRAHYDTLADAARRARDQQLDSLQDWADEQERIIRNTFSQQLALVDAETQAQLDAVQAQIDAIDAVTREEEKAERTRKREQRIADLEAQAAAAETEDERTRILADAAELRAEAEREALLEARDAQKDALRQQLAEIRKHAEERRAAIQEQQAAELEQLRQTTQAKRELLEEQHRRELERIQAEEKAALKGLEEQFKALLKALDDERKAKDDSLKEQLKLVDQEEKAQIASAEDVYRAKKKALEDALKDQQAHTEQLLAEVDRLAEEEKAKIHDKYHGENGLLNEAKVYAEALKLVHDNNQKEILELLDKYEPDWANQGKDFVQRLAEGGWEEKPKVDALGEAIGIVMQAAAENVAYLRETADDGQKELGKILAQLDQAKTAMSELQAIRRQTDAEIAAMEQALKDAEKASQDAEKTLEESKKKQSGGSWDEISQEQNRDRYDDMQKPPSPPPAIPNGDYVDKMYQDYLKQQGARHGGGDVPMSGAYRLLQGERVLSRAERHKYDIGLPKLINAINVADVGRLTNSAPGSRLDGRPLTFHFHFPGARITSRQEAEELIRQASQKMLRNLRQNADPMR